MNPLTRKLQTADHKSLYYVLEPGWLPEFRGTVMLLNGNDWWKADAVIIPILSRALTGLAAAVSASATVDSRISTGGVTIHTSTPLSIAEPSFVYSKLLLVIMVAIVMGRMTVARQF